ncbi:MAG TPA: YceI family protein [Bryobacteraceae bacterium]|nr:YceI family protein [Bryobacteraceae bacterium]
MKRCGLMLLPALCIPLSAAPYAVDLKPASTTIDWTLDSVLHTVHGTFQLKRGSIVFDPDTGAASGEIVVDTASAESGNGARDRKMHDSVLESVKYPEAVFTPSRIEGKLNLNGSSDIKLQGTFRIHGAAHELTLDVKSQIAGGQINADLTFGIPYVAWGMKDPSTFVLRVSKTVQLTAHVAGAITRR